jgi:Tol biopolymer transport system component
LWRSHVDGTQKLQLTSTVPIFAGSPQWSPGGKQIAFAGGDPDHPGLLYVISADGGTPQLLPGAESNAAFPSWMPDGVSIFPSCFSLRRALAWPVP